ncbi:Clp amino terminal domain protein [Lactobacillus iners LactinV 01V1-a]|uniref:Clp amino terminal domain protein n=1 Tax=Lactobacillus iners LactinV 01V1-a TaxID=879297 RepID=E1NUV5_9LACO|nr:Clp amino terminal domain protein [Lactobacillus iners LactinV 01V1-a]
MNIPYSENAKKVLDIAQQKATMLKHAVISTEHVLLAISTMEECSAYQTLKKYKVTESRVENIINEFYSGYGETVVTEEYCIFFTTSQESFAMCPKIGTCFKTGYYYN